MLTVLLVYFTLNGQEFFRPVEVYKSAQECLADEKFLDKTDIVPVGATQVYAQCVEFAHPEIEDEHDPKKDKDWNW